MNQAGRLGMIHGKARLPYKKRVEYLEGDNTTITIGVPPLVAIDTGIIPDIDTDTWECDAQFVDFGSVAGCWGATENRFAFGRGSVNWRDWYYGFGNTNNRTGLNYDYSRHTFILNGPDRRFSIDGSSYQGSGVVVSGYSISVSIFVRNTGNLSSFSIDSAKSRCYSSKYYRNGVLIQHLVPVVDWSDVPCLYDEVTKANFYNVGTGALVAGPDL